MFRNMDILLSMKVSIELIWLSSLICKCNKGQMVVFL